MSENPEISRDQELLRLTSRVLRAEAGQGGVVLIEGLVGMGKSKLIDAFRQSLSSSSDAEHVVTVAAGYCYEVSGSNDAYEPFKEILRDLAEPEERPSLGRLVLELIKETGPDLLRFSHQH